MIIIRTSENIDLFMTDDNELYVKSVLSDFSLDKLVTVYDKDMNLLDDTSTIRDIFNYE